MLLLLKWSSNFPALFEQQTKDVTQLASLFTKEQFNPLKMKVLKHASSNFSILSVLLAGKFIMQSHLMTKLIYYVSLKSMFKLYVHGWKKKEDSKAEI